MLRRDSFISLVRMTPAEAARHVLAIVCLGTLLIAGASAAFAAVKSPSPARKRTAASKPRPAAPKSEKYQIEKGDTLYSLAKERHTSVAALMAANRLTTHRLRIGQVLLLPPLKTDVAAPPPPVSPAAWAEDAQDQLFSPILDAEGANDPTALSGMGQSEVSVRTRLVDSAKQLLGIRYRRSGSSEKSGFDCSGLVQNVFRRFGVDLPRSSREQYKEGIEVPKEQLREGDLIFFTKSRSKIPSHVAIYIGDNQILHALSGARKVVVTAAKGTWFQSRYLGARRMPQLWLEEILAADAAGARQ